jgi:hypothetical protein
MADVMYIPIEYDSTRARLMHELDQDLRHRNKAAILNRKVA